MTTEQQDPIRPVTVTATPDSPGQLLRAAREARGLTQPEVASRLNLRVSLVRDIEEDRFDQRTASTFTRGYLKTYAKLVGASEERVVAAYERLGLTEVKYAEMHSFSGRNRLETNEHRMRIGGWLLCIALAAGVLYWIMGRPAEKPAVVKMDEQTLFDKASSAGVATEPTDEERSPAAQPAAPVAVQPATVSAAATPVVSAATPVAPEATVVAANAVADTALVTASAAVATPAPAVSAAAESVTAATEVAAVDKNALVISYSGPCWLEVKDATGKKVVSATRQAGQRDVLTGKAPFRLNIGAPKYVAISFLGETVDMSRFPVGRPARFELPLKN